eukprot:gene9116-18885_t
MSGDLCDSCNIMPSTAGEVYAVEKIVGSGTYGTVVKAMNQITQKYVAVKRIPLTDDPFDEIILSREIRLLHALRSDNIINLLDVELTERSLYIIMDLCETDLHEMIYSDVRCDSLWTSPDIFLSIMYQVLRAIDFMHSEGVLHRDIKPANILLDYNMKVKLCDFGMARMVGNNGDCQAFAEPCIGNLSENVVTIYYRAPEVMLCQGRYGKAQDVWSIACTFAEVIRKAPLFYGTTDAQQLRLIIDMMGNPSDNHLDFDMSDRARAYVKNITSQETGLEAALPGVHDIHPGILCLLQNMLCFNPYHRLRCSQALRCTIFSSVHATTERNFPTASSVYLETLQEDMNLIEEWGMDVSDNTLKLLECECSRIKKDLISSPIGSYPTLGLNRNLIPSPQHMAPLGNKPPPHDSWLPSSDKETTTVLTPYNEPHCPIIRPSHDNQQNVSHRNSHPWYTTYRRILCSLLGRRRRRRTIVGVQRGSTASISNLDSVQDNSCSRARVGNSGDGGDNVGNNENSPDVSKTSSSFCHKYYCTDSYPSLIGKQNNKKKEPVSPQIDVITATTTTSQIGVTKMPRFEIRVDMSSGPYVNNIKNTHHSDRDGDHKHHHHSVLKRTLHSVKSLFSYSSTTSSSEKMKKGEIMIEKPWRSSLSFRSSTHSQSSSITWRSSITTSTTTRSSSTKSFRGSVCSEKTAKVLPIRSKYIDDTNPYRRRTHVV